MLDNSKHQRDSIETIQVFMDKFKQDGHQTIRETWMNSHFRQEMALSVWVCWPISRAFDPASIDPNEIVHKNPSTQVSTQREVSMLTIECAKYDKSGPKIMGVCVQKHLLNY